jgi:hypothetical protein
MSTQTTATGRSADAVDSAAGAASRFAVELCAWVAAPWAAAEWSWAAGVLVLAVLVALPATFNVPGDKHHGGRAVSGSVRIAIELVLVAAAVIGAGLAWPAWAVAGVGLLVVADLVVGLPRWAWLIRSTTLAHDRTSTPARPSGAR